MRLVALLVFFSCAVSQDLPLTLEPTLEQTLEPTLEPEQMVTRAGLRARLRDEAARWAGESKEATEARLRAIEREFAGPRGKVVELCSLGEAQKSRFPLLNHVRCLGSQSLVAQLMFAREYGEIPQSVERIQTLIKQTRKFQNAAGRGRNLALGVEWNVQREIDYLSKQFPGEAAAESMIRDLKAFAEKRGVMSFAPLLNVLSYVEDDRNATAAVKQAERVKERRARFRQFIADARKLFQKRVTQSTAEAVLALAKAAFEVPREAVTATEKAARRGELQRELGRYRQCGLSKECYFVVLENVGVAADWVWNTEPRAIQERLIREQHERATACRSNCAADRVVDMRFAIALVSDRMAEAQLATLAFAAHCTDGDTRCLQVGENATNGTARSAYNEFERGATAAVNGFADPGVSLAGMVVYCLVLGAIVALVILGLIWKTLFGRLAWVLLLVGIACASVVRLYVWTYAYAPVFPSADALPVNEVAIAIVVGHFVKLIVLAMLLLLVYLLVAKKVVAVAFFVAIGVLAAGVIATVIVIFTSPAILTRIRAEFDDVQMDLGQPSWPIVDYVATVPNIVLSGVAFLASVALCILFGRSLKGAGENNATKGAVYRAFALSIAICVALIMMLALSVAQLQQFDLVCQALFYGVGIIGVEAVILFALLGMVLNSWWTSHLMKTAVNGLSEQPLLEKEDGVPLRYME